MSAAQANDDDSESPGRFSLFPEARRITRSVNSKQFCSGQDKEVTEPKDIDPRFPFQASVAIAATNSVDIDCGKETPLT